MNWFYRQLIRPALFTQDSETIHDRTLRALAWASRRELLCDAVASFFGAPDLPTEVFGLKFPNPVGLAAGMDKNAVAVPMWASLGFGFSELGGVTWHSQPGNPQPRLFRIVAEEALINRMGFNNAGAQAIAQRLAEWQTIKRRPRHPVGINLGKSKSAPIARAAEDYANSFRILWPRADFFVVNVSSPNTLNLRQLQDKAALNEILVALQEVNVTQSQTAAAARVPKPILIKIAPELSFEAMDEILALVGPCQIAGIVATNTTITRPEANDPGSQRIYTETGGLSGRPLRARSTEVIRHLHRQTRGRLPIIGVGGIFTAADAWEKIAAGASLVQLYTSLVYRGPGIARAIVTGLRERLAAEGMKEIRQAVGCEIK